MYEASNQAMANLSRTKEWLASLKQRQKEARQGLFSDLLGKGLDVWKVLQDANLKKGLAKDAPLWQAEADLKVMAQSHANDLATMREKYGFDKMMLDDEQQARLDEIQQNYTRDLWLMEKKYGYDEALRMAQERADKALNDARIEFEGGQNQANRDLTEREGNKDRTAAMDRLLQEGRQQIAAIQAQEGARGTSDNVQEAFHAMYVRAQAETDWFDPETGFIKPENLGKLRAFLEAAIPEDVSDADRRWYMSQIEAIMPIESSQDNPPSTDQPAVTSGGYGTGNTAIDVLTSVPKTGFDMLALPGKVMTTVGKALQGGGVDRPWPVRDVNVSPEERPYVDELKSFFDRLKTLSESDPQAKSDLGLVQKLLADIDANSQTSWAITGKDADLSAKLQDLLQRLRKINTTGQVTGNVGLLK